jgi:glycosyltransferase involved in cell wall biosynthesis
MQRILYVVHSFHNPGGVELHTRTLASGIGDDFEPYIVYPEGDELVVMRPVSSEGAAPSDDRSFAVYFRTKGLKTPQPVTPFRNVDTEKAFDRVLEKVRPDIVHIQHLLGWPLSIGTICLDHKLRTLVSAHDFFLITPAYTMLGASSIEEALSPEYCKRAFGEDLSDYLKKRIAWLQPFVEHATARVAPSPFLKSQLETVYGGDFQVVEYGIQPFDLTGVSRETSPDELVFGYLGALIQQKGWESLVHAFSLARTRNRHIRLELHGGAAQAPPLPAGISWHGPYEQHTLGQRMSRFDVGVIPSLFAESYCMVLSEMWHGGKPVAASRIGALAERVIDGQNGKLFSTGNLADIADQLIWFSENQSWREWSLPEPRLAREMVNEYRSLYRTI